MPVHCSGLKCGWVLLVGLGKAEALSLEGVRKAAGAARTEVVHHELTRLACAISCRHQKLGSTKPPGS